MSASGGSTGIIGHGANEHDWGLIRELINAHPDVAALIRMKTVYLAPDELLVAAKVAFARSARLEDVAASIENLKAAISSAVSTARVIYIEPDVYVVPNEANPSTDVFVIKAAD